MAKSATKKKPPVAARPVRHPQTGGESKRAQARSAQGAEGVRAQSRLRRERLHRQAHRGAGGPGAGAPPPRHVYRRHRRKGAASSVRRSDRQFDGRGAGRARRLDRSRDGGQRLRLRHRQRPRHPGRPAPQVQEQVGAGSDHVHAARRRQIRLESLRNVGRPARRRRVGCQCAVRAHGGRGRARAAALPHGVRARQAEGQAGKSRPRAQPARHQDTIQARSADFRTEGRLQARAHLQDDALQGLSVRRRRNPLALRQGAAQGRRGRAREGHLPFRAGPEGLSVRSAQGCDAGASGNLFRHARQSRLPWRGAMGGRLDRRHRRLPQLLLQHHSDAGRRHA